MTRGKGVASGAVLLALAMACRVSGQRAPDESKAAAIDEAPVAPSASAVCLATIDGNVRMYRLHRERVWVLTMVSPAAGAPPVDVPLPGAEPALRSTDVHLAYRGYDGAVTVALDSSASGATVDVRVDPQAVRTRTPPLPADAARLGTSTAVALPPCRIVPP